MKVIAVSLLIVSLVLHPGVGHAAWQPDGTGVAIAAGEQGRPTIIPDGTGGTIITWYDSRNGNDDIYAQRLNGLGVAQWAPNGVVLCSAQGVQNKPQVVADGSGGAIVAWDDFRNGNKDVFAQRVNSAGVVQWTANGVALCAAVGDQSIDAIPSLVSDGAGGAIAVWTDERNGIANRDIYAQRVNGSGVAQWTANGVALCVAFDMQENATIVSDGVGGAIITWMDNRAGNFDVYAQRVNALGVAQWTANGMAVCTVAGHQFSPETVPDGGGGVIVTWSDYRTGDPDIYVQRLNALGIAQWIMNGVILCFDPALQVAPALVSDGASGAIVAWGDQRWGNYHVYAQRVNGSGVVQWIANGVDLCNAPGDHFFYDQYPGITADGVGGAFVTWMDDRNGVNDIYAQRLRSDGLILLPPNGAAVCTAAGVQDYPQITYTGPFGDAVVTWEDLRGSDLDVYALPVPNTPISPILRYTPYPNGIPALPDPRLYPVHLVFHNVISAGFTYLDITPAGPSLPPSFVLGDGRYYNLSTTAGTTDNIEVCIKFDPAALQHPAAALRMFEYNVAGPAGPTWLDVTTGSAAGDSICGTTTTLSTFVIGWPSVTGVGDTREPASFALHPNLPNPFNPITTIHYDVPAPGADVNISIYDVSGRLIRSLVKDHRGAGTWSVQWNGDNDRGQSVASGVYFYRMRAGEFDRAAKMVLLK